MIHAPQYRASGAPNIAAHFIRPRFHQAPSPWLTRWAHLIAPGAPVLDVACGGGRHLRWLATRGHRVTGVDRDGAALAALAGLGELIEADMENGPWPLPGRRFGAVVVTNYLWRPLMPTLLASVADGGVLIYETFAAGQESVGRPSRPDVLLRPGELLAACAGADWRVVAYEDGWLGEADPPLPNPSPTRGEGLQTPLPPCGGGAGGEGSEGVTSAPGRFVQRIAAVRRSDQPDAGPIRYPL